MSTAPVPTPALPPFDPCEFLRFAQRIVAASSDEVTLRCAVGRAYYATFLVGRRVLKVNQKGGAHKELETRISTMNNSVGAKYLNLLELREQADYHPIPEPGFEDWKKNWEKAELLAVSLIDRFQIWETDATFQARFRAKYP